MRPKEIDRVARAVGIDQVMGRIIRGLSKGFRQRVGLAQALIGDPPIVILDEPTIGLDPRQIREIRELIKGFSKNRTVILSSHILPEVSQVCDRVIIINQGSIVAEDTPANLIKHHRKSFLARVVVRAPEAEAKAVLSGLNGVVSVDCSALPEDGECRIVVETQPHAEIRPDICRAIVGQGWDLLELTPLVASLEDVFIDLVTEEAEEGQTVETAGQKEVA